MRVLTCMGDPTSLATWSNIPYFFLDAGRRCGFLDGSWSVRPEHLRCDRLGWNAWRRLRYGEHGGFQYSEYAIAALLRQVPDRDTASEIISHFPLFPPHERVTACLSFYIDATLAQIFEEYAIDGSCRVGQRMRSAAIEREVQQYQAARFVICMSRWAARSVIERYQVDPAKVHVVPAGANLFQDAVPVPTPLAPPIFSPLRLGFIGKDWRRKGLPFVLEVADVLDRRGISVEVVAAGFDANEGPQHRLLRSVGFIDKHRERERFALFVQSFHFGCLFSIAEAFGISNRECLRLGVPVLARDVGGIADTLPDGLGHLFPADAMADDVADIVSSYVREPSGYVELRLTVLTRADEVTWELALRQMLSIWSSPS
jgi:glycosyltransferase involved in cell wall biosynthesis